VQRPLNAIRDRVSTFYGWFRNPTSNSKAVRPSMPVSNLSAETGERMEEYLEVLDTRLRELRSQTTKT
jgi:hypothetical protein